MRKEFIRPGGVVIVIILLLVANLAIASESVMADSWADDFSGPGIDPRWTEGGIGKVGIRPEGTLHALSYTGDYSEDWHGPFIRTQLSEFGDFDVAAQFRCIAQERLISRLMIRLLNNSGIQLFSFGWSDVLATSNKAEIALYGSSFSDPIFRSGASFQYSNFYDKDIRLARSGQNISFYIDDEAVFSGTSSPTPARYIDVAFLKYKGECTIDVLDINRISVSATSADGPEDADTETPDDPTVPDDPVPPPDTTDNTTQPPSWTDNFTLTSSIVTIIALAVGLGIAFFFLRGGGGGNAKFSKKRKGEKPKPRKRKMRR
ncbi:MAG: hypothetical protein R6W91_00485 [Thermoplasmata archaeon]